MSALKWEARENCVYAGEPPLLTGNTSRLIAECSSDEHARLIASAPDLLEALETVSAHYSASLDYQPPYLAVVRAAILKAKS